MSEGYKPQASDISKTLILTFVLGIVVGAVIGWGARSTIIGAPAPVSPEGTTVAADVPPIPAAPPAVAPPPASPEPATPEVTPAVESAPVAEPTLFDADVEGLWPAAHLWVGIQGTRVDSETQAWLNEFKPGGVVLGPENVVDPLQLGALVLQIKQAVGLGTTISDPPFIVYADSENALPRILAGEPGVAPVNNPDTAAGEALAALKQGVGVFLGPSLDMFIPGVSEAWLEGASLGGSADAVAGPALNYAKQLMAAGLVPVVKQFPGAGLVEAGGDGLWQIPAGEIDQLATAMQPFKAAIDLNIPGIVVGLMAVPGIDTDRPNRPAALSPRLLKLLVRQDWAYTGVLIADDITRHPMTQSLPREEIALKALFSGCDAVILRDANRADLQIICNTFVSLAKRTDFPAEEIQASKQRLKAWLGRLGQPVTDSALPAPAPVVADAQPPTSSAVPEVVPAPNAETPVTTPAPEVTTAEVPPAPETPAATPAPEVTTAEVPSAPEAPDATPAPETAEVPAPDAPVVIAAPVVPVEAPADAPAASAPIREHTIVKGDSLSALAKRYGLSASDLRAWNGMESDVIKIGQVLKLQAPLPETPATPPAPEEGVETVAEPTAEPIVETVVETATPADNTGAAPLAAATDAAPAPAPTAASQPANTDKREHTVASGETLSLVANRYGVSVADIQAWNGLDPEETVINAGAVLVLYLPMAAPEMAGATPAEALAASAPEPGLYDTYVVAPGDNLLRIAERFGTTQSVLINLNGIKDANVVQLGMKLKVPKKPEGAAPSPGTP